ncbi:MAG: hypothetical protein R3B13_29520, partial [Polyangiaceae bacterium]
MIKQFALCLGTLFCVACGGGTPPPEAAPPSAPTTEPEPAAPTAEVPADPPPAPKHVSLAKVEIEGGGIDEAAVRDAVAAGSDAFEACYSESAKSTADLEGRVLVTFLYMKGERKSVSASHGGPAAATINPCFHGAASKLTLTPA